MKKTILMGLLSLSATALLSSCGEEAKPSNGAGGSIYPAVDVDTKVVSSQASRSAESRAGEELTSADLAITLTSKDGSFAKTWPSVADFPVDDTFKIGDYTMEASYGNSAAEGFECPAYYGSTSFTVNENKTTNVSLTATLAQAMVSVEYTDAFRSYMTDWNAELNTSGSDNYIFYAKNETRPAYLRPGNVGLDVTFTKPNGVSATVKVLNFDARARYHYHVSVDLNNGNGGGDLSLEITFDDTLTQENVIIEIGDEIINAPAPEVTAKGFTPGTAVNVVDGVEINGELGVDIMARGGLASVKLTTDCQSLISQGWPAEVELVNTADNIKSRLSALGLNAIGLWKNPDVFASVDFASVPAYLSNDQTDPFSFTLTVTDRFNKSSEPITLNLAPSSLVLNIAQASDYFRAGEPIELTVDFNGTDIENRVKFRYQNDRGTMSDLRMISAVPVSRSTEQYKVTVEAPNVDYNLNIVAVCGKVTSPQISVGLLPSVAGSDNDVFAKHATFGLKGSMPEGAKFLISSDGGNTYTETTATKSGNKYNFTGLEPGKTYSLLVEVEGERSEPFTFTTEAATQLANANMEEWTSTKHKSNCEEFFVGGDIWGTLNPLTISQYGSSVNAAYCATSGTRSTSGVSGNAALIETVGWGSGNTAAGSASSIKHVDRGELFLGKYGATIQDNVLPEYGIAFTSRPSALAFMYKFEAVKNRNGYAEITVLDNDGKTIATKNVEITAQSSYTRMELPLTYSANAPKAAKLIVIFRSTNVGKPLGDGSALGKSDVNTVSFSSSRYHNGSKLYVDDIELIY